MNCINLKQKLDRTLYCKQKKCIIKLSECNGCPYKEYKGNYNNNYKKNKNNVKICKKTAKMHNKLQKTVQIRKKSTKLAKMERERFSILTKDLDHCIFCGAKKDNLHEVIFGSNRLNSIKYGLVIPVCYEHHLECHKNSQLQDDWKIKAQIKFEEVYPDLDFLKIFGKNYIK